MLQSKHHVWRGQFGALRAVIGHEQVLLILIVEAFPLLFRLCEVVTSAWDYVVDVALFASCTGWQRAIEVRLKRLGRAPKELECARGLGAVTLECIVDASACVV